MLGTRPDEDCMHDAAERASSKLESCKIKAIHAHASHTEANKCARPDVSLALTCRGQLGSSFSEEAGWQVLPETAMVMTRGYFILSSTGLALDSRFNDPLCSHSVILSGSSNMLMEERQRARYTVKQI